MERLEREEKKERTERLIGRSLPSRERKRKSDRLSLTQDDTVSMAKDDPVLKSATDQAAVKEAFSTADYELANRLGCPVEALVRKRSSSTSHLGVDRLAAVKRIQSLVNEADGDTDEEESKMCTAHCELACAKNFPVSQAVLSVAEAEGEIEVGVALSSVAIANGQANDTMDSVFDWVAAKAIKGITARNLLFREETIYSKYISNSLFIEGRVFLVAVLRKTLKSVLAKKVHCEVDPAKEPDTDQRSLNEMNLIQAVRNLIEACITSTGKVYQNMRRILGKIHKATLAQFGEDAAYQAVGAVFFLRFVCPNIVLPHTLGIVKEVDATSRRKLILVTKFVQLIANDSDSTTQEWSDRVLERVYTAKCKKKLRKFYEKIISGGKKGKCYFDSLPTVDRVVNEHAERLTSFVVKYEPVLKPELIQRCLTAWDVMTDSQRSQLNKAHAALEKKREKEKVKVENAWPPSMLAVDEFEHSVSSSSSCQRGCKPQQYRKHHGIDTASVWAY